jgi:hypothetical protein
LLLIYEAASRKGWPINGAASAVAGDAFFTAMRDEKISFYDSRAYNRPVNIPGIEWKVRMALQERERAVLPGAILAVREPRRDEYDYEELGGDYGDETEEFGNPFGRHDDDGDEL